jgi:hypothetical protein
MEAAMLRALAIAVGTLDEGESHTVDRPEIISLEESPIVLSQ